MGKDTEDITKIIGANHNKCFIFKRNRKGQETLEEDNAEMYIRRS